MQSMTGYGKSICELSSKTVAIEIKTLNSKQLDVFTRIPTIYKEKELEIRNTISRYLIRGKAELNITYENNDTASTAKINMYNIFSPLFYTNSHVRGEKCCTAKFSAK